MDERILGFDLNDAGSVLTVSDDESVFRFPTVILKGRQEDAWYIGEDAYEHALNANGTVTDLLFAQMKKRGAATMNGVRYEASELLMRFVRMAIEKAVGLTGGIPASRVVFVLPSLEPETSRRFSELLRDSGFDPERTHVIGREEAFLYYAMSQKREVWTNAVGLFDLSGQGLTYYEMTVQRNRKLYLARAEHQELDESFHLELLSTESGVLLADRILLSCAERLLKRKVFSAVLLTGKGFLSYDWAKEFMKFVCTRRKVLLDTELFSRGALVRGAEIKSGRESSGFVCICEGRVGASVSVRVEKRGQQMTFPVIRAGDPVNGAVCSFAFIPRGQSEIEFDVEPTDPKKRKLVRIPLDFMPDRPEKTKRIALHAEFPDERTMSVTLSDAGFGEIFPSSGASVRQEVRLWD